MRPIVLQKMILLTLAIYCVMGVSIKTVPYLQQPEENFYLFFSWSLYSRIPSPAQKEYVVLIDSIGQQKFSPAVPMVKMQGEVYSVLTDYYHTRYANVRALGRAVAEHDATSTKEARTRLENAFIHPHITYEIAEITFNPVVYWKFGSTTRTQTLATFTSGIYE